MKYKLSVEGHATSDDPTDDLQADLDAVMDELMTLDDVEDPFIFLDSSTNNVAFELVVEGENADDGFARAMTLLRTALHAGGIGTSGWSKGERHSKVVEVTSQGVATAA